MAVLVDGHNHDIEDEDIILFLAELERERQIKLKQKCKQLGLDTLTSLPRRSYFNTDGKVDVVQRFEIDKEIKKLSGTTYDHDYMKHVHLYHIFVY